MFDSFRQFINNYIQLSPKEWEKLQDKLIYREVPKKHQLVEIGKISREFYFINKGMVRLHYWRDGEDLTGFFFTEQMLCASLESMLTQTESKQGLECLEDCQLIVLPYQVLERLYEEMPKMNVFARKLFAERMINAQRVVASFILGNPEDRYLNMLRQQPEILHRVPQHMLATYLGITPVSLSRIRKRILEK